MATEFRWPNGKRAAISLTFDDARLSQVDRGLSALDAHGVKATFYVSFAALEKRIDRWRRAVADGHEIGNHTVTHPCSAHFQFARANALEDYTLDRMERELVQANETIERLLGARAETFAYPCGQKFVGRGTQTQSYIPLVAKHFLAGRGFRDESANDPSRCDLAQLCGVDGDCQSFDQLKPWIDGAVAEGGWLILVSHEVGGTNHQTMFADTLDAICRFSRDPANRVWIDTVAAVAAHVRETRKEGTSVS